MNTALATAESPIGHNNPPTDVEILEQRLKNDHAKLFDSARDMLKEIRSITDECENDEQAGTISDLIASATKKVKELDKTREAEKAPYLVLERKVDSTFKVAMDVLNTDKTRINSILTRWLQKKAEDERRRRDEEARLLREKARQEMEAAAALEQAGMTQIAEKAATEARISEMTAQKVESTLTAKPATLANSRGVSGAVSSLRTRWVGVVEKREILDMSALRAYFTDEALQKALNAYVAAGHRSLTGARIFEETTAATR